MTWIKADHEDCMIEYDRQQKRACDAEKEVVKLLDALKNTIHSLEKWEGTRDFRPSDVKAINKARDALKEQA